MSQNTNTMVWCSCLLAALGIRLTEKTILDQLQKMQFGTPFAAMSDEKLKQSFIEATGEVAMQTDAFLKESPERQQKLRNFFTKRRCVGSCVRSSLLTDMRNLQPAQALEAA